MTYPTNQPWAHDIDSAASTRRERLGVSGAEIEWYAMAAVMATIPAIAWGKGDRSVWFLAAMTLAALVGVGLALANEGGERRFERELAETAARNRAILLAADPMRKCGAL